MRLKLYIFLLLCNLNLFVVGVKQTANRSDKLGTTFVILSQPNSYHDNLADLKKVDLLNQASELNSYVSIKVLKSHADFGHVPGHWTVFPLFEKLSKFPMIDWVFFLEDHTHLNISKVLKILSSYDASHEVFVGHALRDSEPTIIHHFASSDGEAALAYPHFSAGFFISRPLVKRLLKPCEDCQFAIDPKYELAKFIWNVAGTKLTHDSRLCLKKDRELCASYTETDFPDCGEPVPSDKIHVAVKTCKKFHKNRVQVVKETWASDVKNLLFFSDESDSAIPTQQVDVSNVEAGHCEKTMVILKHYVVKDISLEWLVLVDDDTLLSFKRLQKLLSCYNSSEDVALGERYGYEARTSYGYDYPTGGSGMVFSRKTARKLASTCVCPSIDSPDDMILGVCLKTLNIPVTHSPHFHQARPLDYSIQFLSAVKHVTFHKHWMIDPFQEYRTWLWEDKPTTVDHSEL